jgi:archaellum component FlaC
MDTDRYIKIRKELDDIKGMIENVNNQMQELRSAIRGAPNENKVLQMRESYQHPWWKYHSERSNVS